MRRVIIIVSILWFASSIPAAFADIYVWTDANGVKNFTNYAPPEQASVFMETVEGEIEGPVAESAAELMRNESEPLHSEQLQAAQKEIEALSEQVAGLREELRDALEPIPEPPPSDDNTVIEPAERVRYRSVIHYGYYPPYDPYGYLWYHNIKKHHRRPGYGRGGYKKAVPYKQRKSYHGSKKKVGRHGASARIGKHRSGLHKSPNIRHRSVGGMSRQTNSHRARDRGGSPSRR